MAIAIFVLFVGFVLFLSFYLARKSSSASGYFAAGGQIHWGVNGIAFAGDYLSAASFLGICGMIATAGYDGFLYSIGYLAGWIVALFVVAEPMKRLGKYTFTDALDSKFDSRGIKLAAAISTLVVSVCYLIPQMVGAGTLVTPLLGLDHWVGVVMVGAIVITIVATAGMTSTTYVQFLKGGLLIVFSTVLVIAVLVRGITTAPDQSKTADGKDAGFHKYITTTLADANVVDEQTVKDLTFVKTENGQWWLKEGDDTLQEIQWVVKFEEMRKGEDGKEELTKVTTVNGEEGDPEDLLRRVGAPLAIAGEKTKAEQNADGETIDVPVTTGAVGPFKFLALLADKDTEIQRWKKAEFEAGDDAVTAYYPVPTPGNEIMRPGLNFPVGGSFMKNLDFLSLMLALFCGTASLPHILIRYYTVPSPAAARKSTIVAIAAIGFFYVLTMYMGLGAMINSTVNPMNNNMSAPLLAQSFGETLFAIISAIAFATVLGTVAGLIVAASGAVAHDLMDRFGNMNMSEKQKVFAGKAAAFGVGIIAIILGILFEELNVSFLVGLAFAVAASANLPAIVMLLFWKKTTAKGITASITVGMVSAMTIILLSPKIFDKVYGIDPASAPFGFDNPGMISIPLSFITLVVVSLLTQGDKKTEA